jgi:sialic acid synthase SpsE
MAELTLGKRRVGDTYPPLVVAEIGINHGGSLAVAREMVDAAARAGVEVVKHQSHVVEDEMSGAAKQVIPGNADVSIYQIMQSCALTPVEESELKRHVEAKGMFFLSTPFSRAAADNLHALGVEAYKIGSGECNNYPLIEHVAAFGKPVILSTGMNSIDSVRPAVEILRRRAIPYALLHCTNVYPTPPQLVRLGAIAQLKQAFPDAVVGLSDHTTANYACLGAVALGASILERHFTDRMDRIGPDIVCSADERAMRDLLEGARQIFLARGGDKAPVPEEQVTMDFAFATVVAIAPIARGEQLTRKNIWVKRPGTGEILARDFDGVLGRAARRDIACDEHLCWSDIES